MGNITKFKMKSALFIAAASALSTGDAPPYFNQPTWNENMPSAAGLLQVSACWKAGGIADVSCGPTNIELFATGMNGDEDLGQDITMKGEKFHYQQKQLIQLNGDDAVPPPEKVSVLDPKIAKTHTTFYGQK